MWRGLSVDKRFLYTLFYIMREITYAFQNTLNSFFLNLLQDNDKTLSKLKMNS